jgi:hypothetical protein
VSDERGVAPVTGKALEAAIVVLYIGLLTTALYGGVVPDYRTEAGQAVAERALAAATERVQQAIPPEARRVRVRHEVSLPDAVRGSAYEVRAEGRWLVLDHPHPEVGARARLALPSRVARVEGKWHSDDPTFVTVRDAEAGLVVRLTNGEAD